jgi:hypothetical protein
MMEVVKAYLIVPKKLETEYVSAHKTKNMIEVTEFLITLLYDLVVRIEADSLAHLDKIVTVTADDRN